MSGISGVGGSYQGPGDLGSSYSTTMEQLSKAMYDILTEVFNNPNHSYSSSTYTQLTQALSAVQNSWNFPTKYQAQFNEMKTTVLADLNNGAGSCTDQQMEAAESAFQNFNNACGPS